MVAGWFANSQYQISDGSDFNWDDEDQGIIEGNIIKLSDILSKSKFKDFRIETKINYEWRNCKQHFQKPCPYFITALVSLVAPICLALFTLLIIFCWSKYLKKGMQGFGVMYRLVFVRSSSFCRTWGELVVYKNCSECQKQFLYTTCSPQF